ncbi:MAG: hypothetical protein CVU84_13730 [Firmicutes bacterium HGW-Firmicutes-1]|jgi:mannose-6-phosphate isomerase-like protein (cupin superfamily)|nr:MAG: hypothetical protein CVU84_13730 [Firmicutes bacterium HGW-Firmicutes-1]
MSENQKQYVFKISELPLTPVSEDEKLTARFILGKDSMLSFIENPPNTEFGIHDHECEQYLLIFEGSVEFVIDGKEVTIGAGEVAYFPGGVSHGGKTVTGMKGLDIFCPAREPHLERMKRYGTMPSVDGTYPKAVK